MALELKVYGWIGWRRECRPTLNGSQQTRKILAATSVAEVLRQTGTRRADYAHSGCDTGNPEEIALAMSRPGVTFWRPLDDAH